MSASAAGPPPAAGPAPELAPGLERLFDRTPAEGSAEIAAAEGEVPAFVRGTYYLNGPARFVHGDLRYRHWLDGDGLVTALAFPGGEAGAVRATHRFVRSVKWTDEEEAGRPLYRAFGTAFAGDRLLRGMALASPVNVSVYPFAGRLLAFGEQGLPWELDPATLETRGEHGFGSLNPVSPFSAHPTIDPASGTMVNFGVSFSAAQPLLHLYRFDVAGALRDRRRLPLDAPCSLHDFGITERHAIFYVNPYLLDVRAMMADGATVMDALSWQPERGSRLLIVDLERGAPAASLAIGSRYCLHHVNAFERADGRLVVDVLELEEPVYKDYQVVPDLFAEVAPAHPVRFVVDLGRGELLAREELPYALAADFPAVDPLLAGRPYRRFWMLAISATGRAGRKFLDQLVAVDWEGGGAAGVTGVYQAPPGRYLGGEPVFLGDAAADPEGDRRPGVILCQELDPAARRADFCLFDAADVGKGPIARLPLPAPIPPCFHASWAPAGPPRRR